MTKLAKATLPDVEWMRSILEHITRDLTAITGRTLEMQSLEVRRELTRPAGEGLVHISFKLSFSGLDQEKHFGALLLPLPEAISMACFLLMLSEEAASSRRQDTTLDSTLKDAMLELGNLIAAACNTAVASLGVADWSVRSEGCQGVRADVRPAFRYEEGSELLVARASARLDPFPPFRLLLMLPPAA